MQSRDAHFPGDDPRRAPKPLGAAERAAITAHLDQDRAALTEILRREQPWRRDLGDPEWDDFANNHS